jgi:hypothetical protein
LGRERGDCKSASRDVVFVEQRWVATGRSDHEYTYHSEAAFDRGVEALRGVTQEVKNATIIYEARDWGNVFATTGSRSLTRRTERRTEE